ncbi:MAG: carboxypeptidase-like regulatory domain-containing protein [Candidatus Altiarchaeota archaeon]
MELKKKILGIIMIMGMVLTASAVRVGVVVEFPDGAVTTECIETPAGTDGYQLMEKTSLNIAWSDGGVWGHGLCGINGTGCPSDDCYCNTEKYWSFHVLNQGAWSYMPVGWDAGDTCWNGDLNSFDGHYCAQEGEVVGYAYGAWGTKPVHKSFEDVCPDTGKAKKERDVSFTGDVTEASSGKELTITSGKPVGFALMDKRTGETVEDVTVEVRNSRLEKLFTVHAGEDGGINLSLDEPGEYRLLVMAQGYPHKQVKLTVEESQVAPTTTSTTTTVTQTTSSTSTTTKLAHFISIEETTTLKPETTTLTTTSIVKTTTQNAGEVITGNILANQPAEKPSNTGTIIIAALLLGGILLARRK